MISDADTKLDVGVFLKDSNTPKECDDILSHLTDAQKYDLITSHVTPSNNLTKDHKSRRFLVSWLDKYSWL